MHTTRRPLSAILVTCLLTLASPGTLAHANGSTASPGSSAASATRARPAYAVEVDSAYLRATRASRRITSMLDEARRMRDRRRVGCLDATLSEMNSRARLLGERAERIDAALRHGDETVARHEAMLASYISRHLGEVEQRAVACVGIVDLHAGTRVTVEITREPNAGEPIDPSVLPPTLPPPL